jgi:hypothetical protein
MNSLEAIDRDSTNTQSTNKRGTSSLSIRLDWSGVAPRRCSYFEIRESIHSPSYYPVNMQHHVLATLCWYGESPMNRLLYHCVEGKHPNRIVS